MEAGGGGGWSDTRVWQMGMCPSAQQKEKVLSTWLLNLLWSLDISELPVPSWAMTDSCEV